MTQSLALKFLPYLRPYRLRFVWALIQIFLISAFDLLKPWPLQIVIDNVFSGKPVAWPALAELSTAGLLTVACLGLVVVTAGSGLMNLLHYITAISIGQRMVADLRGALYAHLQRLSLAFHGRQKVGDLMYRITSDSYAVQSMIMNGLLPILAAVILLAGMLAILFPLDPLLTLLSMTIVPVLFVLIALFNRKIATVAADMRERESLVYTLVQWAMSSVKLTQAFTKEEEEYGRFMGASRASLRASLRLYSWQSFYGGTVSALTAGGTALVLYVGANSVLSGKITLGQLMVFVAYLAQLYAPINQITLSWGLIASARIGARRCFEILDTEPDLADGWREFPPSGARGLVEWRGAAFSYRAETPVLRNIDLRVEPGTRVALVGATGAGKSTMLGLLPRFFDAAAGDVLIDGIDVREYKLKSLRRQISMVLQPPLVFPMSVRDNIAYGRPDASDAQIVEAATLARIHDLVMSLPQGYATMLGDNVALSEGEKQRLTIARAILRDAPILILDEPTSALDVETESLIMTGLERMAKGRTSFIIAHRLSTVRNADLILVLRDGIIAERGNFAELMQRGGIFAQLYNTQFKVTAAPAIRAVT